MGDTRRARVESLIAELEGPNDHLAGGAALQLGSMGAGAALAAPSLVAALARPELANRASHALATIGEPAVPALIPALENLHREIRKGAALTLRSMGPAAADAVPALMAALRDDAGDPLMGTVACFAAHALGNIGARALPSLMAGLRSEDRRVRRGVATALLYMKPESVCPAVLPLTESLADEDHLVRTRAAIVLSHVGPAARSAVPALLGSLGHSDPYLRAEVVGALGCIQDHRPEVTSVLVSALSDSDARVRSAAVRTLGSLGSGQAIPALVKVLRGSSDDMAMQAARALGSLAGWPQLAVPALVAAARTGGPDTRPAAISALGKMGAAGAAPLLAMLEDRDPKVRVDAAGALGDVGPEAPEAISSLVDALGDEEPKVRTAAARALHAIGPAASRSIPALIAAIAEPSTDAGWALSAMGEMAIQPLVAAFASPNVGIRVGAAAALTFWWHLSPDAPEQMEAISTLVRGLDDRDSGISFRAAVALRRIGTAAQPAIPARWRAFVEAARIETGGC